MIPVLLEPINTILVSPVIDKFLPLILDLTEKKMSLKNEEAEERKEGGILQGLVYNRDVVHPSN